MKIKTVVLTILLLSVFSTTFSQNNKKEIELQFTEYLNSIVNREFEKSMNYITDDFFKIIPKAQMISLMEKVFNNPDMEFEIKSPKIIRIEDSELIEQKYYSLLTYSNLLNMKFLGEKEETAAEHKSRINLTELSLDNTFGADNVKYNEKTDFFEVYSEKQVYAISENGETGWKFVVLEKNQKPILEKILPKQLTEKI